MAAQQAFQAQPAAFDRAVLGQCLAGVTRTTGEKPARRRTKGANQILIAVYQLDQNFTHLSSTRPNSVFNFSVPAPASWMPRVLTNTTRSSFCILTACRRNVSLTILLTRFRSTALGNDLLLAMMPSLAFSPSLPAKKTLKCLSPTLSLRRTWSNRSLRNNRCAAVNVATGLLDSEFCTAFCAACIDDCAATAGLHANQKTMGALPAGNGWLICAFHVFSLVNRKARYYKALRHKCQAQFAFLPVDKFLLAM